MKFIEDIQQEIEIFDSKLKDSLSKKASLLHLITNYITQNAGKKIRPICTILSAGLVNNLNDKTYRGAVLIELLHTATLIHDDIVDDAQIRRSVFSINSMWKNKVSVLTGDYFLAKGLNLAVQHKDYDILKLISEVVEKIVEGELMQLEKTKKLNLNEKDYFKIIELKTASLFQSCFHIGAISANLDNNNLSKLHKLGHHIGLLFQIKDDVLDYNIKFYQTGKKSGNDIKEGKINLPLLYSLQEMSFIEKRKVYRILRKNNNNKREVNLVIDMVLKYGGIEKSERLIKNHYNLSLDLLESFDSNKYKKLIISLLNFLINRTR